MGKLLGKERNGMDNGAIVYIWRLVELGRLVGLSAGPVRAAVPSVSV